MDSPPTVTCCCCRGETMSTPGIGHAPDIEKMKRSIRNAFNVFDKDGKGTVVEE